MRLRYAGIILLLASLTIWGEDDLVEVEIPISLNTGQVENTLQITWLTSLKDKAGKTEPVEENPVVRAIESRYKFFRITEKSGTRASKVYPVEWFEVGDRENKYIVSLHDFSDDRSLVEQRLFKTVTHTSGEKKRYLVVDQVSAEDAGFKAEADTVFYQVNEFGYRIYSQPVTFNEDGFYTLRFFSENNMGKAQSMRQLQFWRDKTAPETQVVFSTNARYVGDVFTLTAGSQFTLRSKDNISGVDKTFYSFSQEEGSFIEYSEPVKLAGDFFAGREQQFTVRFYSIDNLGNKEPQKISIFKFDNRAPQLSIRHSQKILRGDIYRLILGINVSDLSQPVTVETWVDGKVIDRKRSGDYHQIVATLTQNPRLVEFVATDALGNEARLKHDLSDLKEERLP